MPDPVVTPAADTSTPAAVTDPAAVAAPAAVETVNLLESAPAGTVPAEPVVAPVVEPAAGPEWFLAEGIKGTGEMPKYYRADKYKTLADQAKAQQDLEKRFGGFSGAPKDGKYEPFKPAPTQIPVDEAHPLIGKFNQWGAENQLSQKARDELLGFFADYETAMVPDVAEIKKEIGPDADSRLQAVRTWASANLDAATYQSLKSVVNSADTFKVFEALVNKQKQPALPKPGADVSGTGTKTEPDIIAEMQAKVGPDGKRLYETNLQYRNEVEQRRIRYFESIQKVA